MLRISLLSLLLLFSVTFQTNAQELTLEEKITFIRKMCPLVKLPDRRVLAVAKWIDEYGEDNCDITIRIGDTHLTASFPGQNVRAHHCKIYTGKGPKGKGPLHETRYEMDCAGQILAGDTPKIPGHPERDLLIFNEREKKFGIEHQLYWANEIRMTVDFFALALLRFQPYKDPRTP